MSLSESESRQIAESAMCRVLQTVMNSPVMALNTDDSRIPNNAIPCLEGSTSISHHRLLCTVRLQVPQRFAEMAIGLLFDPGDSRASKIPASLDLVSELCNMVAGKVSEFWSSQGLICLIGIPTVRFNPDFKLDSGWNMEVGRTHWICAGHWLGLVIETE
jgi:hypothetical protein